MEKVIMLAVLSVEHPTFRAHPVVLICLFKRVIPTLASASQFTYSSKGFVSRNARYASVSQVRSDAVVAVLETNPETTDTADTSNTHTHSEE